MTKTKDRPPVTHDSKKLMRTLLLALLDGERIWFMDLSHVLGLTAAHVRPEGLNVVAANNDTFQIMLSCRRYDLLIEWLDKHHKPYGDIARSVQVQRILLRESMDQR